MGNLINKMKYGVHTFVPPSLEFQGGQNRMVMGLLLSFITMFLLFACATERTYVRRPPGTKVIVLPEKERGTRPYVVNGERYYPLSQADGFVQYGNASWYGKKFHGRPTASGERFNMYKKSAAHKTLPIGTHVLVLNLSNKKSSVVRINDRGPFVKGRIIDLSYAAGKEIGLLGPGVVRVKIVALGKEVGRLQSDGESRPLVELRDMERGEFTIQVGAFEDKENALMVADRLKVIFDYVHIALDMDQNKKTLYKVQVSRSKTMTEAGKIEKKLEEMGFTKAFIVRI
ncbi:MAG: septal ring lytic transglycosylase RlpA family protein [Desulfobacteraceae bacterium]|jgi:rare lipoprotein A